ncbi:hypothetical protein GIB67_017142 [Kingdonia uniflora]|uniref:Ribosomal protein S2 n=1 Tax=Kingdonia uniflora TaxID=39325 RepID=A0A7J7MPK3_9MAGN|nr:hypothetical protein GIB67_017142 [Kingdonia uniflora]
MTLYSFKLGKNLGRKLQLAARAIVTIENPQDIIIQSTRPYDQRAVLKFSQYTGAHPIAGKYTPGTFTNQCQTSFSEPRLLILTNPRTDHQPIKEGCLFWLLARMVSHMCGIILPGQKWDVIVNLFFYIKSEETKEQEEEAPVYIEGFLWRLRRSILASYLFLAGIEWTIQPVAVAVEADGNSWDDAPAPLIVVLGKDKNDYIRGFGDMSSAKLESTLPFRMKLANENATNTNLQS